MPISHSSMLPILTLCIPTKLPRGSKGVGMGVSGIVSCEEKLDSSHKRQNKEDPHPLALGCVWWCLQRGTAMWGAPVPLRLHQQPWTHYMKTLPATSPLRSKRGHWCQWGSSRGSLCGQGVAPWDGTSRKPRMNLGPDETTREVCIQVPRRMASTNTS